MKKLILSIVLIAFVLTSCNQDSNEKPNSDSNHMNDDNMMHDNDSMTHDNSNTM